MENFELIENYFEGKLSEEEKASVESLLLSNSDFKDEFELYKNIVFGIKEAGKEHCFYPMLKGLKYQPSHLCLLFSNPV